MFSSRNMSNVYRKVDVETGVNGASPHHLITMLFNGALDAIAQARGAMLNGQIEQKCAAINKCLSIVDEGLKAGLDQRAGGDLAQQLDMLYAYIATRLTLANLRNDPAALEECANLLTPIRDAWMAIAPNTEAPASHATMRIQA
ncbi:MAG: flagellar export chaperone FliS [Aquabacterium sp.]|nr:flagellar export chaperone FliS [Aquabacterium sp.]